MDERSAGLYKEQQSRNALKRIEFCRHALSSDDKSELLSVLDSIFLTTGGVVCAFEKKFASYLNTKYAVGVTSCTHALELALRYFNISEGDEVITTPLSFVATANSIEYVGATPVFVDVEEDTGNINAELIEYAITSRTKAIVPVHLYGQMCDMLKIRAIADKYGLKIIEDSAHCIEGDRDGVQPGQLGDVACFSFYATKNLTCGEGGAITCNDQTMYEWLLSARQHGITKDAATRYTKKFEHYDMLFLGMKCNMSNIQAALLLNQLDRLDFLWRQRGDIVSCYNRSFNSLKTIKTCLSAKNAFHLYTILVDNDKRDLYLHQLQDNGIGVAVNYSPIHLMSYYVDKYKYKKGCFPVSEFIGASTITLPLYPMLSASDVDCIINKVLLVLSNG